MHDQPLNFRLRISTNHGLIITSSPLWASTYHQILFKGKKFLFYIKKLLEKNECFFGAIGDQKDCFRGVPEGGCAPLCPGGFEGGVAPSPVETKW